MSKLRLFVGCAVLCLSLAPLRADHELTGTWDGEVSVTRPCGSGTLTWRSPVRLALTQSGETFRGNLTILNEADVENCQIRGTFSITAPVSGHISGNSFGGTVATPDGARTFTGTVTGESMTFSGAGGSETRSFNLTRTTSAPPDSQLSGIWEGPWSSTFVPCCRLAPIQVSGAFIANLTQTGADVSGSLQVSGDKEDRDQNGVCTLSDVPVYQAALVGQINGNTLSGHILSDDGTFPFTATFDSTTLKGTAGAPTCPGETPASFTMGRRSSTPTPAPTVSSFAASPSSIAAGQSSTLSWSTQNASSVTIDNGVGSRPASGSVTVTPRVTTTYRLTATGAGGTATATTTVSVSGGAARVVISSFPRGFVQLAGEGGGTDSFSLSNIGEAETSVTLTATGNFFTISENAFVLPAGSSRTVTITGTPQAAGSYEGTITISGNGAPANAGVRVRMLSAAAPTGTVAPQPAAARLEVSSPAGQNVPGTVDFTNRGNATLQGIAVADVPWIVPQSGVITIPPGQTVAVNYTIDVAKRPDASAPAGAATGKISLVFISSPVAPGVSANGASSSAVSVTLVHVVRPGVSPGTPPPIASGELAFFVAGLGNRANAVGDLLLANRQSTPLTDVRLFLQAIGAPPQAAAIPQLVANSSVSFPGLMKNVFNLPVSTGTAQLRGSDAGKISVAATQTNTSSPAGTFGTALPVFRSDRGIDNGGRILLTGLVKNAAVQTNVYVQELSGNAGSYEIEFLDADGRIVAARSPENIGAFGFVELSDALPALSGIAVARVTNRGAGTKLNAYALVTSAASGDAWLVTDSVTEGATDALIVPVVSAGQGAETTLFLTNGSSQSATVSLDVRAVVGKRRAAPRNGSSGLPPTNAVTALTLDPLKSAVVPIAATSGGYVRVTAPAGAIAVAARSTRDAGGGNVHGTGLTATPAARGLAAGESRRFPGLDDASSSSRAQRTPATFRTSLLLVESTGQDATVRVTLHFAFSSGPLVSSSATVSREYVLAAGEVRLIADLARDVIGPNRDSFGDLRNMTLDVEVVGGSGRVIPFVHSVDNGSGDSIVRVE